MSGLARRVECIQRKPAEIGNISRGPDHSCDPRLGQINRQDRATNTLCIRHDFARAGLLRKVQPEATRIVIRLVQNGQIVCIPRREIFAKIRRHGQTARFIALNPAQKHHAAGGKTAKINRMPPMRAADRNCDMLRPRFARRNIPFAKDTKPPAIIPSPVGTRRAVMRADRDIDPPPTLQQFLGNLRARGSRPHHKNRPFRQLPRIAIRRRMHLQKLGALGNHAGKHWLLKRSCGRNDRSRFNHTL